MKKFSNHKFRFQYPQLHSKYNFILPFKLLPYHTTSVALPDLHCFVFCYTAWEAYLHISYFMESCSLTEMCCGNPMPSVVHWCKTIPSMIHPYLKEKGRGIPVLQSHSILSLHSPAGWQGEMSSSLPSAATHRVQLLLVYKCPLVYGVYRPRPLAAGSTTCLQHPSLHPAASSLDTSNTPN